MKKREPLHPDRAIVLEIVTRMRESQAAARNAYGMEKYMWTVRAATLNEVYTELKGGLLGEF